MQSVQPAMKTCYNVSIEGFHDLLTYFASFPSFEKYVKLVGDTALNNFFKWYNWEQKMVLAVKA